MRGDPGKKTGGFGQFDVTFYHGENLEVMGREILRLGNWKIVLSAGGWVG